MLFIHSEKNELNFINRKNLTKIFFNNINWEKKFSWNWFKNRQ